MKALIEALEEQRRHVLGIVAGLTDEDLRRPVLPSGWSCLGLVNHLALDVELFWFRAVVGGEQSAIAELAGVTDAWRIGPDVPAHDVIDRYRREISRARSVIEATPPDAAPAWWPTDLFGSWRLSSHVEVLLHVLTETACHAGHLDAARELIDGGQWLVLTGGPAPTGIAVDLPR
jgi:hypothetical protein